jgi:dTDP-4-dehydrorhamnose 3,5-epimerase
MKILDVRSLSIPEVKVIRFARFLDNRGYFSEHFRKSDLKRHPDTSSVFQNIELLQMNESFSRPGVIRGLHFQWNPFMGKLVRTLSGHMIDIFLDIRKGSPTYGRAAMYDMPEDMTRDFSEWIWVPPGFAHGNFFEAEGLIEYLCSCEYSQGCEAGISPLASDIDWTLCDKLLKSRFDAALSGDFVMTDKDRNSFTLRDWEKDMRSDNFIYGKC